MALALTLTLALKLSRCGTRAAPPPRRQRRIAPTTQCTRWQRLHNPSPSALQLSPPFALHSYLHSYLRPPPSALHSALSRTIARYLTHWTLVLELLYLWLAVYSTYMAIYDTKVPDGVGKATPWFISATYAMQPLVLVGSFLVFMGYWALVCTGAYEPRDGISLIVIAVHGVNFVVMLADLLLVRNPLYLSHVLVPMAYSIAYLLFSVLFYAVSGDNIYSALDWSDPAGASRLCALILFLMVPILWIPVYCIFLGRRCYRVSTSRGQVQDGGDADGQVQAGAGQRLGGEMLR